MIVHRISRKEPVVPRINLMLIESGEIQHYCFVKRESALLFDKAINNKTFYCMMCLTRFTRAHLLEDHKKYCNGVNGRPTRIEMPEEGKNILSFQHYHKQMKAPYVIYADFEALVKKIPGCERGPDSKNKSYTEKTKWHEACGYSYVVVKSDGEVTGPKVYRGENAVKEFLNGILQEETKIRESLATPKSIVMTDEDWKEYKNAKNSQICNKSLIKDEYLDSLPVFKIEEGGESSYRGQWHKRCYYMVQKQRQEEQKIKKEVMIEENDTIEIKKEAEKKGQRDSHTKTRNREKGPGEGKGTGELLFL